MPPTGFLSCLPSFFTPHNSDWKGGEPHLPSFFTPHNSDWKGGEPHLVPSTLGYRLQSISDKGTVAYIQVNRL